MSPGAPAVDFCLARHGTTQFTGPILANAGRAAGLSYATVTRYFDVDAARYDVRLVAPGAYISLPIAITMHRLRDVRWLNPPRPGRKPPGWSVVVGATRRVVAVRDFPTETLLNVNLPAIPGDQVKGVRATRLGSRVFHEEIAQMKDPWGREIYWIGGGHATWSGGPDSDFRAVKDGYISVTPLHVDMTNHQLIEAVQAWNLG